MTAAGLLHYKYTQNRRAIHRSVAFRRPNLLAKHTRTPAQTLIDLAQHRSFQPGRSGCLTGIKKRRHPRFTTSKIVPMLSAKRAGFGAVVCTGKPRRSGKTIWATYRCRGGGAAWTVGPSRVFKNRIPIKIMGELTISILLLRGLIKYKWRERNV